MIYYVHIAGEHFKNWRTRYFVLREDGSFLGFRQKPESADAPPLNDFDVAGCQILAAEQPRPNTFLVRCRHANSLQVERTFCVELEEERRSWMRALASVAGGRAGAAAAEGGTVGGGGGEEAEERGRCRRPRVKRELGDFELLKVLGKGGYGKVFLSRDRTSGGLCAIKVLKKSDVVEKNLEAKAMEEVKVLQLTKHPFILASSIFSRAKRQSQQRLFYST